MSMGLQRTSGNSWLVAPANMGELFRFAELLATSAFCPRDMKGKPGDVLAAIQMGAEVGLSAIQSLQNICVINGKPSIYGDAMLALVLADPSVIDVVETFNTDKTEATCTVTRKRGEHVRTTVGTFSMDDARKAKLDKKSGPWTDYPPRMLKFRARGFALRDACADIIKGLITREEAEDITTVRATVVESKAVQEPAPEAAEKPRTLPAAGPKEYIENNPQPKETVHPGLHIPLIEGKKHAKAGQPISVLDDEEVVNYIRAMMHVAESPKWAKEMEPKIRHAKTWALRERGLKDNAFSQSKADRSEQLKAAVNQKPDSRFEYSEEVYLCEHFGMCDEGTPRDIREWTNPEKLIEYSTWLRGKYTQPTQHVRIEVVEARLEQLVKEEAERAEAALSKTA